MLRVRTAPGNCPCWTARREAARCTPDAHQHNVSVGSVKPAGPGSRSTQQSGLRSSQRTARHRRRTQQLAAVPPDLPSAGGADPQQVWPLVQQVWQALAEVATRQPPSDASTAEALQDTGSSAWRTLLTLHLLRSGCGAAQLSASTSASQPQPSPGAAAAQQPQTVLAVAAKDPAGGSSSSGSSSSSGGGGRGGAVQPPSATAEVAAGRSGSSGGGGGGGSGKAAKARRPDIGTLWGLLVLGLAYVHHSTTGFALPALLPLVNEDLHLTDAQGALLTSGYTVLYAAALVPVGLLADKADRPRLLAAGIAAWSVLTMAASQVNGFAALIILRIGFAIAQAAQNPVCFGLIPELFPEQRTTAMAAYNSAIYMGRALSFGAVILAGQLGIPTGDIGIQMVPLDAVDPSRQSLLYTQGDQAAVTPIYDYDFSILYGAAAQSSWREILWWVGPPGLAIACLALLTLDEPRAPPGAGLTGPPASSSRFLPSSSSKSRKPQRRNTGGAKATSSGGSAAGGGAAAAAAVAAPGATSARLETWPLIKTLLTSPGFQAVTWASAMNDVGSWALVAWQATFYQRVFELGPDVYAPLLAAIIPVGGIIGGVGGGLAGDWLSRKGGRAWLTTGASIAAGPVLAVSILAPDYQQSFAALLIGFALSECWRAPSAIMVRDVSPPNAGSTASAIHLCIRNFIGGCGPLGVAWLSERVGLQHAMLLVPSCYVLSGIFFWYAEALLKAEKAEKAQKAAAAAEKRS